MKATKNMNTAELKITLDKYTAKHPVTDKFDLQGLQLCEYAENIRAAVQIGNNEAVSQIIANMRAWRICYQLNKEKHFVKL